MKKTTLIPVLLTLTFMFACADIVAEESANEAAAIHRRPDQFAIIYGMGYAEDHFPQDKASFEKLIQAVKQANYNTVLCKYEDWRAEICKAQGVKIMVDMLVPENHVYKNLEGAEALCQQLRDNDVVYAYHLWSDRIGGTAEGRNRDAANVHKWDPHHAVYVGSYNARAVDAVTEADLIGYYDFHWMRGGLYRHLIRAQQAAEKTDAYFLRYAQGDPGRIGAGNYNRVLYTHTQSMAFGLKGYMYHFTGMEINKSTWQWQPLGEDLAKVNAEIAPLGPEMMKIGRPRAVYSTPITKTAKDRETGSDKPIVPEELTSLPEDLWVQIAAGEALMGMFNYEPSGDALFFANHNAYQMQSMKLHFTMPVQSVQKFDRAESNWTDLKIADNSVSFPIPPAAGELLRVQR